MSIRRMVLPSAMAMLCAACAQPFQVVQLPERNADLMPLHHQVSAYVVAVDEIADPDRARMYFGTDFLERGILPVNVIVSNSGRDRLLVRPSDILLRRGNTVIDPIPHEEVIALARESRRLNRETREELDAYFAQITFSETVVGSGDTYQGVLFFRGVTGRGDRVSRTMFRAISLYQEGAARIEVAATAIDAGERVRFGPFPLSSASPFGAVRRR